MGNTFFGKITRVVFTNNSYRFTVDATRISDDLLESGNADWNVLETYIISFTLDNDEYAEYFIDDIGDILELEGKWIRINASQSPEGYAGMSMFSTSSPNVLEDFDSYNLAGQSITILRIEDKNHSNLISQLLVLVRLDEYYAPKKTEETLSLLDKTLINTKLDLVSVVNFNVGHGNTVGVFNENYDPLIYIDIGGGAYSNKKTYGNTLDFPTKDGTFIILTHWDSDHFETAFRNPEKFSACVWLAPLQESNFSIKKFASIIKDNLALVKDELNSFRQFPLGKIIRCTGDKRNDCGLAIKLELEKVNDISDILFPGDAQYEFIDESLKMVDAINVTHHGGKMYSIKGFPIPKKRGEGFAVYSYGKLNTYGHPNMQTVNIHVQNGWGADRFGKKYSLSTSNMSVMYTKNRELADKFHSKHTELGPINCFFGIEYNSMPCKGVTHSKQLSQINND